MVKYSSQKGSPEYKRNSENWIPNTQRTQFKKANDKKKRYFLREGSQTANKFMKKKPLKIFSHQRNASK
jgi:hypothetical protein